MSQELEFKLDQILEVQEEEKIVAGVKQELAQSKVEIKQRGSTVPMQPPARSSAPKNNAPAAETASPERASFSRGGTSPGGLSEGEPPLKIYEALPQENFPHTVPPARSATVPLGSGAGRVLLQDCPVAAPPTSPQHKPTPLTLGDLLDQPSPAQPLAPTAPLAPPRTTNPTMPLNPAGQHLPPPLLSKSTSTADASPACPSLEAGSSPLQKGAASSERQNTARLPSPRLASSALSPASPGPPLSLWTRSLQALHNRPLFFLLPPVVVLLLTGLLFLFW